MSNLDDWKFAEHLTVLEFALLEKGYDPTNFESISYSNFDDEVRSRIRPFVTALNGQIESDKIEYKTYRREEDGMIIPDQCRVLVADLIAWAHSRGVKLSFFGRPDYEVDLTFGNRTSEFYAPKLQAAVDAWAAVSSDKKLLRNTTPKGAIKSWLTRNAARYDLIGEDGKPSKSAIEAIAQVANWRQKGGAPTTGVPEDDLDF